MASTYDVVIVGGGIAGLSLASALAGKCTVALVEAEQQLAYHTSSRSARQLIPSYGPPVVQELTVRTLELIAADDAGHARPVLSPRSFLLIGDEETVRAEASGEMRLISHEEALGLCPALKPEAFSAAGLTRDVAFEVTNADFLARLVGQGLGVAMLPAAYVAQLSGVTTIEVIDAPARVEYIIWSPDSRTPAATAFLRVLGVPDAEAAS